MLPATDSEAAPGRNRVRVTSRFRIRGVWVAADCLGHSFTWDSGDHRVSVRLPVLPTDFQRDDDAEPPIPACRPAQTAWGSAIAIDLVQVAVDLTAPINAADHARARSAEVDGEEQRSYLRHARSVLDAGDDTARRAVHAWMTHVRVISDQEWLGTVVEPPTQYGLTELIDVEAGTRLLAVGPEQTVVGRHSDLALSRDQLTSVAQSVMAGGEPPVAETLLTDARFLAFGADVVDGQRAVLLAAIACEVKVTATILAKVGREGARSIGLGSTSDLDELLDAKLTAAFGVSLRRKDQSLAKKIRKLAGKRNRIVHQGDSVDPEHVRGHITAAVQLFAWLDQLPAEPASTTTGANSPGLGGSG